MKTRKLFVLANSIWAADDYLNDRNCNPRCTDLYLFATREEAEGKAKELPFDNEIYNDGTIYAGEIDEREILELTGFEKMKEFEIALAEPYSTDARATNFGEFEKREVAEAIVNGDSEYYDVACANYDYDKSLEGAVLVFWIWERYIGYARKFIEIRYADSNDREALLTKQDKVLTTQCDVLLTADEVNGCEDVQAAILDKLKDGAWKWTNERYMQDCVERF